MKFKVTKEVDCGFDRDCKLGHTPHPQPIEKIDNIPKEYLVKNRYVTPSAYQDLINKLNELIRAHNKK